MKRFLGSMRGRQRRNVDVMPNGDSPEASAARGVRLFCESAGPNNSGEEVLHLPVIVEAAESSPSAAREAANVIRRFLSKENLSKAYVQYNSIMLVRILADNPGATFTRNLDSKFVITVKELLRDGRDASVQQILRETLEAFQVQKGSDENLAPLVAMWTKEKQKSSRQSFVPGPRTINAPPFNPQQLYNPQQQYDHQQNYFARNHRSRGLPSPPELAQRVEEAKTSGKLLQQTVQSTPPSELLGNELVREFAERCQSASRSIQSYIHSEDPPPDDDTLLTLIETNDQLSLAISKHQHAILQARRSVGPVPAPTSPQFEPPAGPPPQKQPSQPLNSTQNGQTPFADLNGFRDTKISHHPRESQTLQAPFNPFSLHEYGAPSPSSSFQANSTQEPQELPESSVQRPNHLSPQNSAGQTNGGSSFHPTHGADAEDEPPSPVEVRRPAQYRF